MSNLKLKQLLNKKSKVLTFLIVCSLFICEKALAEWGKSCCTVEYFSTNPVKKGSRIEINFKFFEYSLSSAQKNSYLENIVVEYLTNDGQSYTHLMTASTKDQNAKTSAVINLNIKRKGEDIRLYKQPQLEHPQKVEHMWGDHMKIFPFSSFNHPKYKNQTWLMVHWYPKEVKNKITHVRIIAKWKQSGTSTSECPIVYPIYPKELKLNSNSLNFSNSSPKQEIRTADKMNTVKAYRNANSIVVKGALSEMIQIYTTSGKLVKSMVADSDVHQIPVPANQVYIVYLEQTSYKVAL